MTENSDPQSLHDKSTRGGVLNAGEQANLAQWYAHLDQEESRMLAKDTPAERDLTQLRVQVNAVAAQLVAGAQRIQSLVAENDKLRNEIVAIEEQLAGKQVVQSA